MNKALAYFLPLVLYLGIPLLLGRLAGDHSAYVLMVLATGLALVFFRKEYPLTGGFAIPLALLAGIVAGLLWILLEGRYPPFLSAGTEGAAPTGVFLAVRILGALAIAPIVEELFTRGFLVRYVMALDWSAVPIGTFTLTSFCLSTLFFGFSHTQWLSGLLVGALFNILLLKTKSLRSTILAHSAANVVLVAFTLAAGRGTFLS